MRSRGWIVATIGFAILAAACTRNGATPGPEQRRPIAVGDAAPAFTLDSASGEAVSLSDYAGKPVLLYFSMGPG
jgi:cytochrome oxidase Cu insertion factor (SCO1/SenC/PrrC family)